MFSPGEQVTVFDVDGVRFGLCICFDIRFVELFRKMTLMGAQAVLVPAAFNMTTGPMHWDLTFRARALDNQIFTVGVAPARDPGGCYVSYANSIVCTPWGEIAAKAGADAQVIICDLNFTEVAKVRKQLPILSARKPEVY